MPPSASTGRASCNRKELKRRECAAWETGRQSISPVPEQSPSAEHMCLRCAPSATCSSTHITGTSVSSCLSQGRGQHNAHQHSSRTGVLNCSCPRVIGAHNANLVPKGGGQKQDASYHNATWPSITCSCAHPACFGQRLHQIRLKPVADSVCVYQQTPAHLLSSSVMTATSSCKTKPQQHSQTAWIATQMSHHYTPVFLCTTTSYGFQLSDDR